VNIAAVHFDHAGIGLIQAAEYLQQGGLAGARSANNCQALAARGCEKIVTFDKSAAKLPGFELLS